MAATFEPVPHDATCATCSGRQPVTPLPPPLDGVYCISLQEQPYRTRAAAEHFHAVGLCRHVTFFRPTRAINTDRGVWESHRAVAREAIARGRRAALILEDDVDFRVDWERLAPRVARAFAALPETWWGLFLGHFPWQVYFLTPYLLRARSTCLHAYIAGPRLLAWLGGTIPLGAEVPVWKRIGESVDAATSNLPEMYALFPMVAKQRFLGDFRVDARIDLRGRPRRWTDIERWRYLMMFHGARVVEGLAVAGALYHRVTLEYFRKRVETQANRDAATIRASGLWDDAFYLDSNPDVVAKGTDALKHYLKFGAAEHRRPLLWFDPEHYAAQSPDLGGDNPLTHYIRYGAALRRNPHPLFDTGHYVDTYGNRIPAGMNPLGHFLTVGGVTGCNPHPDFDCAQYWRDNPDLPAAGQNALVHYLRVGWAEDRPQPKSRTPARSEAELAPPLAEGAQP